MCLAEFAAWYVPTKCKELKKNRNTDQSDEEIEEDNDSEEFDRIIKLNKESLGYMKRRTKMAVIRTHKFKDHTSEYFFGRLMLFFPWRNESDLIGKYETFQDHYNDVFEYVESNAKKFNFDRKDIDCAVDEFLNNGIQESEWEKLNTVEVEDNIDEDIAKLLVGDKENEKKVNVFTSVLAQKYRTEAKKRILDQIEYYKMMRSLNEEQKQIVMFNRRWAKESVKRIKEGKSTEGYKIFLSGPGGTGKSTVIKMINRDIVEIFTKKNAIKNDDGNLLNDINVDDPVSLIGAFTGTSARWLAASGWRSASWTAPTWRTSRPPSSPTPRW